jgi:hypothetical protein
MSQKEDVPPSRTLSRLGVSPELSAVLIECRSNVGPISFATTDISGYLEASITRDLIASDPRPIAQLALDLRTLRSGNSFYDAELARRIDVRTFPVTTVVLRSMRAGTSGRYLVDGEVTLHGETVTIEGSVQARLAADGSCSIVGEHVFDIRDFRIPTPSVLMFRIFPDVRVRMQIELRPMQSASSS